MITDIGGLFAFQPTDTGEPERNGSLLVTTHGSGRLVYTGLAFFGQPPAGVPGAFSLFANLLAK